MDLEAYARSHPIRAEFIALYEEDKGRSLTALALLGDLGDEDTSLALVTYHVRVLRGAGLLPEED
jgi:hypothetical protein